MLETILFDNPEIDEAVRLYCETDPKYQTLETECEEKRRALQDAFLAWDDAYNAKWVFLTQAYYHMGLGLRQELFSSLGLTARSEP